MKKIKYLLLFGFMTFLPIGVNAASEELIIDCPQTAVEGQVFSCDVSITPKNISSLRKIFFKNNLGDLIYETFVFNKDIAFLFTSEDFYSVGFDLKTPLTGRIEIGTFKIRMPEKSAGKTYTFQVTPVALTGEFDPDTSIVPVDGNNNMFTLITTPNSIKSVEASTTSTGLSSLTVSDGTINFNPDTKEYSLTVNSPKVTINAVADSKSTVTGTGTKDLNYGLNTFPIVVTSESGTKTTYTLKITRTEEKSKDNYLSKLEIDGQKIEFDREKSDYNLELDNNIDSIKINYTVSAATSKLEIITNNDLKQNVEGSIINISNLQIGKNVITLKVTSESGESRSYNINIERKEGSSSMAENPNTGLFGGISVVIGVALVGCISFIVIRKKSKFSQL